MERKVLLVSAFLVLEMQNNQLTNFIIHEKYYFYIVLLIVYIVLLYILMINLHLILLIFHLMSCNILPVVIFKMIDKC